MGHTVALWAGFPGIPPRDGGSPSCPDPNQPARHRKKVTGIGGTSKLLSRHFQTQRGLFMMTGMYAQAVFLDTPGRGDSTS